MTWRPQQSPEEEGDLQPKQKGEEEGDLTKKIYKKGKKNKGIKPL